MFGNGPLWIIRVIPIFVQKAAETVSAKLMDQYVFPISDKIHLATSIEGV